MMIRLTQVASFGLELIAEPPRKKYLSTQKPAGKKCDCPYCGLSGGMDEKPSSSAIRKAPSLVGLDQKSSSSAIRKAPSLVGNPKYKQDSPSTRRSTPRVVGNGSVTIQKITSTESSWKRITPKPDREDCIPSTKKVEPTPNLQTQKELHECVCGNSYSRKDNLERHVRFCEIVIANSLKTVADSKIKCECGLGFDCVYSLVRHKKQSCTGRSTMDLSGHKLVGDLRDTGGNGFVTAAEEQEEDDCGSPPSQAPAYGKRGDTGANSSSSAGKSSGDFLCRCGKSHKSYSALVSHQKESCDFSATNKEGDGTFECGCGRGFPRLCHLARHISACSIVDAKVRVGAAVKVEEDGDIKCECGVTYGKLSSLAQHRETCRLRKKALPSSSKSSSSGPSQLRDKKLKLKAAANRCKCGVQFTMVQNLNRHIQSTCRLYKGKPKPKPTDRRKNPSQMIGYSKFHVRGSKVIHSKKWGTVRGPPFVCKCGASYLNYESFGFHKRTTCKISDTSQTSSKAQKSPANTLLDHRAAEVKLERMDMTNYPEMGKVFDLSTAVKFKCVCGKEFYSKFSLNGHSRHCKDFLAKKRTAETCTICKATFSSRGYLVRHVRYMHHGVSNMKVGAKVKKIVAKSPKKSPEFRPVIENVRSLADSS